MPYQFAGFLATDPVVRPAHMPADSVWRKIEDPFVGVGLLLPDLIGKVMEESQVLALAASLGLDSAAKWIFLQYDCWGGEIDYVYGLGSSDGERFGPIEESALDKVQSTYIALMAHLGITESEALSFKPFDRGFWSEP